MGSFSILLDDNLIIDQESLNFKSKTPKHPNFSTLCCSILFSRIFLKLFKKICNMQISSTKIIISDFFINQEKECFEFTPNGRSTEIILIELVIL